MSDEAKTIAEIEALLALANQEVFLRDESPHPHEEQNDRIRAARTQIANHARKTFIPALLAIVKRQQEREAVLREALKNVASRAHAAIAGGPT